jgi:hypothetical protein
VGNLAQPIRRTIPRSTGKREHYIEGNFASKAHPISQQTQETTKTLRNSRKSEGLYFNNMKGGEGARAFVNIV